MSYRPDGRRVLMVLPPDFEAPLTMKAHRFPSQGPALVAAAIRTDGIRVRIADLELDMFERPAPYGAHVLDDDRVDRFLLGKRDDELVAFAEDLLARLGDLDVDALAFSLDRHTQITTALVMAVVSKRRLGLPVILGGGNGTAASERLQRIGARGVDFATGAYTPAELRVVFRTLLETDRGRWEPVADPLHAPIATEPDAWPTPDFSVYDLARYRRDPFTVQGDASFPQYDGSIGKRLFLPYHFSWDCQYACSFCQRGGVQNAKSMETVVRDLAAMVEAYDCRDFMLFDAQINLHAEAFSRALLAAKLNIHWTDSFRVAPRKPADVLGQMAEAGCVGLTIGVESASDRVLKRMVKGHSAAKATAIVHDADQSNMFVRVNLLPCFPGETRGDHEITVAWIREHAGVIDDIAPSAFYMAKGSPVGQAPERYGVVLRGEREIYGDHKFRKNLGSLAYDEIGGYTWEEREATLRPAEEELSAAWREGRRRATLPCVSPPAQTFALRHAFASKREAYVNLSSWMADAAGRPGGGVSERPREALSISGDYRPDAVENSAPPPRELPTTSLRARAAETVRRALARHGLSVPAPVDESGRFSFEIRDRDGRSVRVIAERVREGASSLRRGRRLMAWYQSVAREPPWTGAVLPKVAELLCSSTFDGIADEIPKHLAVVRTQAVQRVQPAAYRRASVIDAVRAGLKPAGTALVDDTPDILASVADLPGRTLSYTVFARDSGDNLVRGRASEAGSVGAWSRILYVAGTQRDAERVRDIENRLYPLEGSPPETSERIALHKEIGRLLGFPRCCVQRFAESDRTPNARSDFYASIEALGWDFAPIDWRYNHIAARQYELPFLIHLPCSSSCAATRDLVEVTVARMYADGSRPVIEEVLTQGAVVWPDDRILFFRPLGRRSDDGVLAVTAFNVDAQPEVLFSPRRASRTIARDACTLPDASIDAIRKRGDTLEVRAAGRWEVYAPSIAPTGAPPLVVTPTPAAARAQIEQP